MEIRLGTGRAVELDARGRPVDRAALERRGLLVVGRRLREERDRDDRAGRRHRPLSAVERRALLAVQAEELGR